MTTTMADVIAETTAPPQDGGEDEPSREELLAMIAAQQAIIEERWSATTILHTAPGTSGFGALLRTPFGSLLAEYCGAVISQENVVNFIALEVDHPDHGAMMFSVHRRNGESPVEQLRALRAEHDRVRTERDLARAERDAARAQVDVLRAILTDAAARSAAAPPADGAS